MTAGRASSDWRLYWKAILAFLAPGLILLTEGVLADGNLSAMELRRAIVTAATTCLLVYFKRNGISSDPTTSTPQREEREEENI